MRIYIYNIYLYVERDIERYIKRYEEIRIYVYKYKERDIERCEDIERYRDI